MIQYKKNYKTSHGFGILTAVIILVGISLLAGYAVYLSNIQQQKLAMDVESHRALLALKSGIDWVRYGISRPDENGNKLGCPVLSNNAMSIGDGKSSFTVLGFEDDSILHRFNVAISCEMSCYTEEKGAIDGGILQYGQCENSNINATGTTLTNHTSQNNYVFNVSATAFYKEAASSSDMIVRQLTTVVAPDRTLMRFLIKDEIKAQNCQGVPKPSDAGYNSNNQTHVLCGV